MSQIEDTDILRRALMEGKRRPDELSEAERHLLGDELADLELIIASTSKLQMPVASNKEAAWEQLMGRMEADVVAQDTKEQEEATTEVRQLADFQKQSWKQYLRIAAILVLGLGVSSWYFLFRTITISTVAAEIKTVELEDGSVVTLSPASSLSYPVQNWGRNTVHLEGEAFFEVSKQIEGSFAVKTKDITVEVLGTSFNVSDRPGRSGIACAEGHVAVYAGSDLVTLRAGEAVKNKGAQFTGKPYIVKPSEVGAWQKGWFQFNNEPLSLVLAEVERRYDISVILDIQTEQRFTGTFQKETLEEVLTVICLPLGLEYTITEKQVRIRKP